MGLSRWLRTLTLTTTGLVAAALLTTACSHSQKRAENPPTPQQQIQAQQNSDRAAYVNQTQARIDQLANYSQTLKSKAATAPKPNDLKMQNSAQDLDSFLDDARKSLTQLKTAAPQNWIDYKRDVEKSMDRAESEFNNSASLIR